jgi:hypothetical protein
VESENIYSQMCCKFIKTISIILRYKLFVFLSESHKRNKSDEKEEETSSFKKPKIIQSTGQKFGNFSNW